MEPRLCENCCFWLNLSAIEQHGECHRYAPMTGRHSFPVIINKTVPGKISTHSHREYLAVFPVTHESQWCGEWRNNGEASCSFQDSKDTS